MFSASCTHTILFENYHYGRRVQLSDNQGQGVKGGSVASGAQAHEHIRDALGGVLATSLRPVCVGLGLFFSLLAGWFLFQLEGPARTTMASATGLLAFGLVVAAVWFERNRLPARAANPVAALIGMAVVLNCLMLLVSVPEPRMTTHLMIAVLGFGCLLFSVRWFAALCALSLGGWLWVVGARRVDPDWYHFGLALGEATLFAMLVLALRIRAYSDVQRLRRRDQALMCQLAEANQAARAAVKAKSEFLANMSHELRTPMTAMLGMTELLQMTSLDDDQRDYADTIARSGDTLLSLVNDILDFSKIEAGRLDVEVVPFNLRKLLQEVHQMLHVKATQKRLKLDTSYDRDLPERFRGDPTRLKQVLVNLAGNAIKFTQRGCVTLRAEGRETTPELWTIQISVVDTGVGIASDMVEEVFKPFTQADASTTRQFGGTGLGLTISNELTHLMGGELSVTSVEGQGSTFMVQVPLPIEHSRTVYPANRDSVRTDFRGHVLLVEDNKENQLLAERMLKSFGCDVAVANDGAEAVSKLSGEHFDLVFMDCQMRTMNGYEATEAIRQREDAGKRTPIVALTANVLPEERARCQAVGMDGYVSKPFTYQDLHRVLERWL